MILTDLTSHALIARLAELLALERSTVVDELLCLAEIERRDLHLEMGFSSMFVFCTEHLKLPKSSAYRRSTVARLITRFPIAVDYLRDRRLSVRTLFELRDAMTDDNHCSLLERAAGRTEDQIRELLACLCPKPAPRDVIRSVSAQPDLFVCDQSHLGARRELEVESPREPDAALTATEHVGTRLDVDPVPSDRNEAGPGRELEIARAARELRAATVEPLSADLRRMHVTVSREFLADLEKVKALLSHSIPGGNLEEILHACIKKTIEVCEQRRKGSDRPRPRRPKTAPKDRLIPTAVRREVWARDAGKCTFVGTDGKQCGETHFLQFHHIVPSGRRGPSTPNNVTLHCAAHNDYEAKREYGEAYMRMVKERRLYTRRSRARGPT